LSSVRLSGSRSLGYSHFIWTLLSGGHQFEVWWKNRPVEELSDGRIAVDQEISFRSNFLSLDSNFLIILSTYIFLPKENWYPLPISIIKNYVISNNESIKIPATFSSQLHLSRCLFLVWFCCALWREIKTKFFSIGVVPVCRISEIFVQSETKHCHHWH
jgi:hypothetical protein